MYRSFDELQSRMISEQVKLKKVRKQIVDEGVKDAVKDFISSVGSSAIAGAVGGAALGTIGSAALGTPTPMAAGAGAVLGLPIGALAGTVSWLKGLLTSKSEEKCTESDKSKVKELLKKINDKTFSLKDNEKLEELQEKYA